MSAQFPPVSAVPGSPGKTAARIALLFTGLIVAVPSSVYYHALPLLSFYTDWLAFFFGISACAALAMQRPFINATIPRIVLAPVTLLLVIALQAVTQHPAYHEPAIQAALYLLWAIALMWVGATVRETLGWRETCTVLAWFFVAGGLLGAVAGLLQHYQFHTVLDPIIARKMSAAVHGNFAQANHFADYLSLSIASLLYLMDRGKLALWTGIGVITVMLYMLALTGSRSGWLYLTAFVLLAGIFYYRVRERHFKMLLILAGVLLPLYFGLQLMSQTAWFAPAASVVISPADRLLASVGGASARVDIWEAAWLMFIGSPLLGVGFQQFGWSYFQLSDVLVNSVNGLPANAHNLVMQLLATTGIVGTAGVVWALGGWLKGNTSLRSGLEHWWMWALLAVLAIHSLLEFPLWYANFLGVAAFLLGMGELRPCWFCLRKRSIVVLFVAAGYIIAIDTLWHYAKLEWWLNIYKRPPDAAMARQQDQALLDLREASLFAPTIDAMLANVIELDKTQSAEKLAFNSRVMAFSQGRAVVYRQVILLALNGDTPGAKTQLDRAVAVYPDDLPAFAAQVKKLRERDAQSFSALAALVEAKLPTSRISKQ